MLPALHFLRRASDLANAAQGGHDGQALLDWLAEPDTDPKQPNDIELRVHLPKSDKLQFVEVCAI